MPWAQRDETELRTPRRRPKDDAGNNATLRLHRQTRRGIIRRPVLQESWRVALCPKLISGCAYTESKPGTPHESGSTPSAARLSARFNAQKSALLRNLPRQQNQTLTFAFWGRNFPYLSPSGQSQFPFSASTNPALPAAHSLYMPASSISINSSSPMSTFSGTGGIGGHNCSRPASILAG